MTVAAGVITRQGRILIGQRKRDTQHPLKWEFPGGKLEPNETAQTALVRELREELGIEAVVGGEMARYPYSYNGRAPIELVFLAVSGFSGEPCNMAFERIAWVDPSRLAELDFLEGDAEFIQRLLSGGFETVFKFS